MTIALRYSHTSICYGQKEVIHDVSFDLKKGEILALVGESGSGKSTLLKAAMGLLGENGCVTRGSIFCPAGHGTWIDLPDAGKARMREIRGARIAMIFQNPEETFCPVRRIRDLFFEETRAHGLFGPGRREKLRCLEEASSLLVKTGLRNPEDILNAFPFELSGGMLQRTAIAMALMLKPDVILADEPTSALDVVSQKLTAQELSGIRKSFGTSILLVTHNIALAACMADRIVVLKDGEKVEEGTKDQVLCRPESDYTRELLSSVLRLRGREDPHER